MTVRQKFDDALMKSVNVVHRILLAVSGGRLGSRIGAMPTVELHTIGRISGSRHSTMLTAPVHGDDRWVLVASKGGDDRDPEWYSNLQANPDAELTVGQRTVPVRTRTASGGEKAELWPQIVAVSSRYADYQRKTAREIPVVICEART